PAVTAERTREPAKNGAVVGCETRTRDLPLQYGELVAEHEDLDIFGAIPSTAQHQEVDYEANKTVETRHTPILAPEPRRPCRHETAGHHTRRVFGTHKAARAMITGRSERPTSVRTYS